MPAIPPTFKTPQEAIETLADNPKEAMVIWANYHLAQWERWLEKVAHDSESEALVQVEIHYWSAILNHFSEAETCQPV